MLITQLLEQDFVKNLRDPEFLNDLSILLVSFPLAIDVYFSWIQLNFPLGTFHVRHSLLELSAIGVYKLSCFVACVVPVKVSIRLQTDDFRL